MSEQARQREPGDALLAVQRESAGAERCRRSQRHATSGRAGAIERRGPLEFDERGLPIPQRHPSFTRRVRKLLNPQKLTSPELR
jgi:hypothetical protein